jgi:hypothetical protein
MELTDSKSPTVPGFGSILASSIQASQFVVEERVAPIPVSIAEAGNLRLTAAKNSHLYICGWICWLRAVMLPPGRRSEGERHSMAYSRGEFAVAQGIPQNFPPKMT